MSDNFFLDGGLHLFSEDPVRPDESTDSSVFECFTGPIDWETVHAVARVIEEQYAASISQAAREMANAVRSERNTDGGGGERIDSARAEFERQIAIAFERWDSQRARFLRDVRAL